MSENQKKVWITGASSGIGKALAEKYAKEGWKVAISARRKNLLDQLSENENIYSYPLDVTNSKEIDETFKKILQDFNNLDLCIFSSGIYERKLEKEINVSSIRNTIEINFIGTVNSVKSVESYFKQKKDGQIAIVSSPVGYRGLPKSTGYSPSKAALNNFTQGIYFDFKKFNVGVSLISPGFIKTQLTDKNDFHMPFLKSTDYAAEKIFKGLKNKDFEIIFPLPIAIMYRIFNILPNSLYNFLIGKLVNR
mgnify:CR=1 FL=1|tara:strand:- start:1456 stop:2205 length:750 start_codon:yes stop_codon:yes gene_type:complete